MPDEVCEYPKTGRILKWPYVAHGFTKLAAVSFNRARLVHPTNPALNITANVIIRDKNWWVYFDVTVPDKFEPYYNLEFFHSDYPTDVKLRVPKVRPVHRKALLSASGQPSFTAPAVSFPTEGSTVSSHISLIAYGELLPGTALQEATLEYIQAQIIVNGAILHNGSDGNPWIASFSCIGPTGLHEVVLTIRDNESPANVTSVNFTLTDDRIDIEPEP